MTKWFVNNDIKEIYSHCSFTCCKGLKFKISSTAKLVKDEIIRIRILFQDIEIQKYKISTVNTDVYQSQL